MFLKNFLYPNKYKIIIFFLFFSAVFLVPYLEAKPSPGMEKLITAGHYPLIFIFLISLVALADLAAGNFSPGGLILTAGFLFSFFLLYALSAALGGLISRYRRKKTEQKEALTTADDKLVIRFRDKDE